MLSLHPSLLVRLNAISYASPTWLTEVAAGYNLNLASRKILQELLIDPTSHLPYSLINGVIHIRDQIWVGDKKLLHLRILEALHSSALGGHSSFPVTYASIRKFFT